VVVVGGGTVGSVVGEVAPMGGGVTVVGGAVETGVGGLAAIVVVGPLGGSTVGSVCVCVRPGGGAGVLRVGAAVVDVVVEVVVGAWVGTEATSDFVGAFLLTAGFLTALALFFVLVA
jgi:hypothetical protein